MDNVVDAAGCQCGENPIQRANFVIAGDCAGCWPSGHSTIGSWPESIWNFSISCRGFRIEYRHPETGEDSRCAEERFASCSASPDCRCAENDRSAAVGFQKGQRGAGSSRASGVRQVRLQQSTTPRNRSGEITSASRVFQRIGVGQRGGGLESCASSPMKEPA